jgi:WD40 repeat protein
LNKNYNNINNMKNKSKNIILLFIIHYSLFITHCIFAQSPEIKVQIGHSGIITQVAYSPDGKLALSASWDKTIKLWEITTGRLIRTFEGHDGHVNAISFSPDGNNIFSGGDDKVIFCWDIFTGNILKKYEGSESEITSISVSPDGKLLASSEGDLIKIWNTVNAKIMTDLTGHSSTVNALKFSNDGLFLISSTIKELKLWNVSTGKIEREFDINTYGYYSPVFSPDDKFILTGSGDRIIRLMEISTGKLIKTYEGNESRVTTVAFSPDGKSIVAGSDDKTVTLRDLNSSQIISTFLSHNDDVRYVCFSPDGKYVLSSTGTEIMLSEAESGRFVRKLEGHTKAISSMVYTPDGKYVLTGCFDNTLKLWEISTGKLINSYEGHTDLVKAVAVSSDGKYALSGAADNTVRLWDISSAKLLKTFEGHENLVTSVAFSPDGKFALSGSWDNTVKLWNISTGRIIHTFRGHQWFVTSVAFSPDGNFALSGGYDNIIILWDLSKNKFNKSFEYSDRITTVAFSPDGEKVLSGSCDYTLALWDIKTGKTIKNFEGHTYYISSAVFSSDGKSILSGSEDKTMKLWDISSGRVIKTFEGHTARIMSVCISPDGKHALSSSADNKMKLWDLNSGDEIANFITFFSKDYMVITPDNYYLSSKNGVKVLAFVIGNNAYPPEQYDLKYNRPDIVLKRIGLAPDELINAYYNAYLKRLKKMNFNEDMFNEDFQLPEVKLLTEKIPLTTEEKNLKLKIKAEDSKYNLDRLNVFINDVPVYGSAGINLRENNSNLYQTELNLELSKKKNKIQISVLNEKGAESLFKTFDINYETRLTKPDLYVLTIGTSDYSDSKYNLRYAAKDANDIAELMNGNKEVYNEIKTLKILDKDVNKQNILKAKEFLMQSKVDDEVIVFIAGHGLLTKEFDYYYATSDIDFSNPKEKGITFEEIENLLDGISARKKILFMDTCHSGEIDKDDIQEVKKKNVEVGEVSFRSVGETEYVSKNDKKFGLKNISQLLQDMFVDLRRSSGAIVISSSGGLEFAWEGGGFKNGLFTYCLLEGLKTKNADLNKDGDITINELKNYVSDKVDKLTNGAQKPTARRENLDFDFIIW